MKCPEEMERLERSIKYEVRLRPVLKRQRFWRWILRLWSYKAHESRLTNSGYTRAKRSIGPAEKRDFAAKRHEDREDDGLRVISWNAKRVGRGWIVSDICVWYYRNERMKKINNWGTSLYFGGQCW